MELDEAIEYYDRPSEEMSEEEIEEEIEEEEIEEEMTRDEIEEEIYKLEDKIADINNQIEEYQQMLYELDYSESEDEE